MVVVVPPGVETVVSFIEDDFSLQPTVAIANKLRTNIEIKDFFMVLHFLKKGVVIPACAGMT